MDSLNILLMILIGYILYIFTTYSPNNKVKNVNNFNSNRKIFKDVDADTIIDDVIKWDDKYDYGIIKKDLVKPNFMNNKFHNDYRDVITALNNLVPDRKQLFNLANIPLNYSEPEVDEVKKLLVDFITVLNENLRSEVPTVRNPNSGWDEAIPDPRIKSGWEKVQNSLGLPGSLYEEPALKSRVKIIDVEFVQKYETDDEIKYSIRLIIQKENVDDQMLIKASFVQDKRELLNEDNFFKLKTIEMRIIIEELFILGYYSDFGHDMKNQFDHEREKYYDYNRLEHNNLVDPKYVQKILMDKYRQRTEEMEHRVAMLDEEGQAFHKHLPHTYDFASYKNTRTIFDDMNETKHFI